LANELITRGHHVILWLPANKWEYGRFFHKEL
jgi:hypothetical protein